MPNTTKDLEEYRALFESMWRVKWNADNGIPFARKTNGDYMSPSIDYNYEGWCMAIEAFATTTGNATSIELNWSKLREVYAQAGAGDEGKLALVEYGIALARATPQHPKAEFVTLESAMRAIEHVEQYNGPGRKAQATALLDAATPQHSVSVKMPPVPKYETVLLAGDRGNINDMTIQQAMNGEIQEHRLRAVLYSAFDTTIQHGVTERASIDTPEFRDLLTRYSDARESGPFTLEFSTRRNLIAYIDSRAQPEQTLDARARAAAEEVRKAVNEITGPGFLVRLEALDIASIILATTATEHNDQDPNCSCPSGNGSLRWPCPMHNKGDKQNG